MNLLLSIVIQTANILGIFTDPFEFEGDYGSEVNPIRQQVFELVVSKEALAKNGSGQDIVEAIYEDQEHGPTLMQLVTPELLQEIEKYSPPQTLNLPLL